MNTALRIVFMGTPDFAAHILRAVAAWDGGTVVAAYCREDKPAGRGHKLMPPPVKTAAQELGIPVMQPRNFKDEADRAALAALKPDVLVVAAYGLILPQTVLDIPRLGPYNVHASLLPRYRGAAPIQRAIMDGEHATGITIMRMEAGLDTGPMVLQRALGIGIDDTAATLHNELADLGARMMVEALESMRAGHAPDSIPQNDALSTYAARLEKGDGCIDWNNETLAVHALARGVTPWPGAQAVACLPGREPLPLLFSHGKPGPALPDAHLPPGTITGLVDGCIAVACKDGLYLIGSIKASGKKAMDAQAFWNGYMPRTAPYGMLCPPDNTLEK